MWVHESAGDDGNIYLFFHFVKSFTPLNSFPSGPLNSQRSSLETIKNSQKMALLPFASKFGVQEVGKCSHFGVRHLNVSYMTNFFKQHILIVQYGIRPKEILSRIYQSRRHFRYDLEFR